MLVIGISHPLHAAALNILSLEKGSRNLKRLKYQILISRFIYRFESPSPQIIKLPDHQ